MTNIDYDKIEICLDSSFSNEDRVLALDNAFDNEKSEKDLGLIDGFWLVQKNRLQSGDGLTKKARDILEDYLD